LLPGAPVPNARYVLKPAATPIRAATDAAIREAAVLLRDGRLVAFPTETVYGLGADATNERAVAAVFAAKGRPRFNPLIVHIAGTAAAANLVILNKTAHILMEAFWPGPLTIVAHRSAASPVALLASAGLDTIAIRAPAHPIARALIDACGRPVAAPSANRSEELSPTRAGHVAESLGGAAAMILDGGSCAIGLESTIIDTTTDPPSLLRPGGLQAQDVAAVIGRLDQQRNRAVRAPGMLKRHYAPSRPLRLDAKSAEPGEVLLAFGPDAPDDALNLSKVGDLAEAAANLFAMLRTLDTPVVSAIAVMPIPDRGLGQAINDRLRRGAASGNSTFPSNR